MTDSREPMADPTLEGVLRLCAAAEPSPWYPSAHVRDTGVPRERLDPVLDVLRLSGLIKLTDWVQGLGQGYVLTPEGREALQNPRQLARLREGQVPRVPSPSVPIVRPGNFSTWERGEAVREVLLNPPAPVFSKLLLWVNVAVFLYGLFLAQQQGVPGNEYLYGQQRGDQQQGVGAILGQLGALDREALLRGEWWRLLTCAFVHVGLMHLGFNMFALYRIGPAAEQMWGRWRFLVLYLVAALVCSCAAMMAGPMGVAGASGALCGLIAAEVSWVLLNRAFLPPSQVALWTRQMGFNLVLIVLISMVPGVSWSGHLGGAVGGLLVGALWTYQRFGLPWQRIAALAGIVLVPVLAVGLMLRTLAHDPHWQRLELINRYFPVVQALEDQALGVYRTQVLPLLATPARARNPQDVQRALQGLAGARDRLNQAIAVLDGIGAYSDPAAEAERQRYLAIFRRNLQVFDEAEQRLGQGP